MDTVKGKCPKCGSHDTYLHEQEPGMEQMAGCHKCDSHYPAEQLEPIKGTYVKDLLAQRKEGNGKT